MKTAIQFEEPYQVPERVQREVYYAGKEELLMNIRKEFAVHQKTECSEKRSDYMSSYGGA